MSQPLRAIIIQLWSKNVPLLEHYLAEYGPRTVLTFHGCVTADFEAMLKRHGSELVVIDPLLDSMLGATTEAFAERAALPFGASVAAGMAPQLEAAGVSWADWQATMQEVAKAIMPSSFALVDALDRLATLYEIELIAVNEDWMFGSKTLVAWGKARGIPSLHVEHNPTLCYPYTVHDQQNADQMVVWSEDSRRLYGDAGYNTERLLVTGLPQFDDLLAMREERSAARLALCEELGLDNQLPIVVLGTTLLAEHALPPELSIDEQVLRAYLEVARTLGDRVQVIIKGRRPQGRFGEEQVAVLAGLCGTSAQSYRYADGAALPFLLAADVLVAVDSGLQVEAMLVGTPALNLMTQTGFFYGPGLVPEQGVDTVAADELSAAIERLLEDREHRQRMLERANAYVERLPRNATASIAALMSSMALRAPRRLYASDQLLDWLQSGAPTGKTLAVILDHLEAHSPRAPRLGVVVLDRQGDVERVVTTLQSLTQSLYSHFVPMLLSSDAQLVEQVDIVARQIQDGAHVEVLNELLLDSDFDWLLVVEAGVEFTSSGLLAIAQRIVAEPQCRALYADEFQRSPLGARGASFKPDFNLDLLLSFPQSLCRNWFFRADVWRAEDGFNPIFADAMELEFILRLVEREGLQGLAHVADVLLTSPMPQLRVNPVEQVAIERHLEQRGYPAAQVASLAPGRYYIDYGHAQQPRVSIVVAVRDHLPLVQRCVDSLLEKTRYANYELLLVDCGSRESLAQGWLASVEALDSEQVRVWRFDGEFNFSAMVNAVAVTVTSDYLVLLSHDTQVVQEDWLEQLLNQAQRPEVGVVGGKVLDEQGNIEQAGIVLGLHEAAGRAFAGEANDAPGYMNRLQLVQNYSAVGAACLMVRRELFAEVGGLDEQNLRTFYGDVDLCLRIRAAGYLNVWTPHSVVVRTGIELPARAIETPALMQAAFAAERKEMFRRWLPELARDPAYNRNLSLANSGFLFDYSSHRVQSLLPQVLCYAADSSGCGHYRVRQPFAAMRDEGLIDGLVTNIHMPPLEMERFQAQTVVFQRQVTEHQIAEMLEVKELSRAFKVYELDDYLPNLPLKSVHREAMPRDVRKSLRRAVSLVDRFVVSTAPLAEAFADMHSDIQVVANRLPVNWWGHLRGARRVGRKPRVGWAGGISHAGDLELIADVVRDLANEVEWVFFGMCPERLKPYVHEFHGGVAIEQYPAMLASLNLDLALAPLEQNQFNDCKSNLRLLEYGVLGFPVVCSDVLCYRDGLPVTRVKNRYRDWIDAIRMHLADLDATARMGDQLQEIVRRDWMLEGENLQCWAKAWLPD